MNKIPAVRWPSTSLSEDNSSPSGDNSPRRNTNLKRSTTTFRGAAPIGRIPNDGKLFRRLARRTVGAKACSIPSLVQAARR
jgi:hypothetical protein